MLFELLVFIPAILWGITDPLIRKLSSGIENIKADNIIKKTYLEFKYIFTNLNYLIVFALNQSGSFFYYLALVYSNISLVVPITNSLTLVITTITGYFLGEQITLRTVIGLVFIIIGVSLCVS